MITYNKTLGEFYQDVQENRIVEEVTSKLGFKVTESERRSFRNSLPAIYIALRNYEFPKDIEVALEYKIPLTDRRIDFLMAGADENNRDHIVICELKQWSEVKHTDLPDVVMMMGEDKVHPSWQVYSYGSTLCNFNDYFESGTVTIEMCTFLHNYKREYAEELLDPVYMEGIEKATPFISDQYKELANFISKYIKTSSKKKLLYEMENGRIRPSKMLVDSLESMLKGNEEYQLIDDQRIAASRIIDTVKKCTRSDDHRKHVIIVEGGAGTGKSVIAIQVLSTLIKEKGLKAFFVSKNSCVRESYFAKLTRYDPSKKFLKSLFLGSGRFIGSDYNEFDVLLVDEAHRLTEKTKGFRGYSGENQIKEIIDASKVSVFFLDETQNVDIKDYGTAENILRIAEEEGAEIENNSHFKLSTQFRCSSGDEYIAWLESVLYNKPYIPSGLETDYDLRIIDDITEFKNLIVEKNRLSEKPSRMLSGDVFPWKSKTDGKAVDIVIDDFQAQWNRKLTFPVDQDAIYQVGSIHRCQGMDFEYAGVIIADDLIYRDGKVMTDYTKHPDKAAEFKRPRARKIKPEDLPHIDTIIRNTYKVLMTRGMRGTYLYIMDPALKEYIGERIRDLNPHPIAKTI